MNTNAWLLSYMTCVTQEVQRAVTLPLITQAQAVVEGKSAIEITAL